MSREGDLGGAQRGPWFTGPESDPLRYRIEDPEQGRGGGQGIVYPALDRRGRCVALKLLSDPELDFARVLTFAAALERVKHPNLVRQLDVFMGTGFCERDEVRGEGGYPYDVPYTVCEWVDGSNLTEAVVGAAPAQRIAWVADIARAVASLHADPSVPGGIVHRDVKPANVRVTSEGRAVLVDYGCARHVDGDPMTVGVGTAGWRAPEVVLDPQRVGQAADAWGVAALAFWSFTGEPPQLVSAAEHRERLEVAARRAGARDPVALAAAVAALLATEQDTRPKDLIRWADRLVATEQKRHRRRKVAALVVVVALSALLIGRFGVTAMNSRGTPEASPVGLGPVGEIDDARNPSTTSSLGGVTAVPSNEASQTVTVPEAAGSKPGPADPATVVTAPPAGQPPPATTTPTTSATAPPVTAAATTQPSTARRTWAETTGGETRTGLRLTQ